MVLSWSHQAAGQAGSNSLNDQLIQAAKTGDTAAVRQLLDQGATSSQRRLRRQKRR